MMRPSEAYQERVQRGEYIADPAQQLALNALDRLASDLVARSSGWRAVFNAFGYQRIAPRGLYLVGDVGRGKTALMDFFYQSLPFETKRRVHFHRFMLEVHRALQSLQGQSDPLNHYVQTLSKSIRVLCLDEFFVQDIADAMILSRMLSLFSEKGITLVTTSNIPPDALYKNGLQRQRFLPAIHWLKTHTEIIQLDGDTDHRYQILSEQETYLFPLSRETQAAMQTAFERIATDTIERNGSFEILGRNIKKQAESNDVLWVDFEAMCLTNRSQLDYLEIAQCYHTVLISGVLAMSDRRLDAARRFVYLIDALYDHKVKLIISAEVPLDSLYSGMRLATEFSRTGSRLREMQSESYLHMGHISLCTTQRPK